MVTNILLVLLIVLIIGLIGALNAASDLLIRISGQLDLHKGQTHTREEGQKIDFLL